MRRFEDKVVLVTGAASGIGRAAALRMAEEGAALFCADVQSDTVREAAEQAAGRGGEAESRVCDISRPEDVGATVTACIDRFGKLDSLCNAAGILHMEHFHELALEDWNRVLAVNLTGTMSDVPGRAPAPARDRRQHRQRLLDVGPRRAAVGHRVRRLEGGPARLHLRARDRVRAAGASGQRRLPGIGHDADDGKPRRCPRASTPR